MKIKIVFLFVLFGFLSINAFASEPREIELTDGSVISAEIISINNGIYTLKSDTMGTIKINDSKIKEIRLKQKKSPQTLSNTNLQSIQQSIMTNESVMKMIMGLQNDPEIQKLLQNQDIMQAVNSGDIASLMSNPEFIKIMENAKIQGITQELIK